MKNKSYQLSARKWLSATLLFLLLPLLISAVDFSSSSLTLTQRQLCDLELIMNGGFSPLNSFMNRQDYERVVDDMHLSDGSIWPMPIVLDIQEKNLEKIKIGSQVTLKDQEGFVLAQLAVDEIWQPNKLVEAEKVYGAQAQIILVLTIFLIKQVITMFQGN